MKLLLILLVLAGTFCGGLYVGQHPDAPQLREGINRFTHWVNETGDAATEQVSSADGARE